MIDTGMKDKKGRKPKVGSLGSMNSQKKGPTHSDSDAYRSVNIISFRKNFKALIGHYKKDDSSRIA